MAKSLATMVLKALAKNASKKCKNTFNKVILRELMHKFIYCS
jgi:hypothetical protein